jgi:hypothetical protein
MFVGVADTTCLRQGDILEGIPFPRLAAGEMSILGIISHETPQPHVPCLTAATMTHRDDSSWISAQVPVRLSYCAIISQCCDLEARNGRMVIPTFALARLISIPQSIISDAQRLASLRSNKDPRVGSDPGFINFFHVPSHSRLDGREWIVDYNQIVSVPGREFPAILSKKILQMENDWRVKFKVKLATCLARLTEEERSAGLENPWRAKQENIKFPVKSNP